jgi:DNA-binding response OmpR family regulator
MTGPLLLLVEDSAEITYIVRRYAKAAGFEVQSFDAVAPAWDFLQSAMPTLLLLDLNLPGENGLELCRRLRATPGRDSLPVALFGSWDRPEDIAAGLRAGIDFVVEKALLVQRDAWTARVAEILNAVDSRTGRLPLNWIETQGTVPATEQAIEAFQQALRHPTLLQLDPEVVEALVERTWSNVARMLDFAHGDRHDWLLPDGRTVNPVWLTRPDASVVLGTWAAVLTDQVDGLLGAAGAVFRRDLAAALSPPSQPLH